MREYKTPFIKLNIIITLLVFNVCCRLLMGSDSLTRRRQNSESTFIFRRDHQHSFIFLSLLTVRFREESNRKCKIIIGRKSFVKRFSSFSLRFVFRFLKIRCEDHFSRVKNIKKKFLVRDARWNVKVRGHHN